jgi:hypothetical protein
MIDADLQLEKAHREALEEKLLGQFDRAGFASPQRSARVRQTALVAALATIAIIFTASRAPADYSLELGQSIEVRAKPGSDLPRGPQLGALIEAGLRASEGQGQRRQVELKVTRDEAGATTLVISVWGAPIAGIVEQLHAHVPELANAEITARTVEGRVHTNLAGVLAHRFLPGDPAALEQLRREVRDELREEGVPDDAEINVEAGPAGDGTQRVRVEVHQKQTTR